MSRCSIACPARKAGAATSTAPARERPGQLSAGQLETAGRRRPARTYDEARHDWHANFGILRTPQLAAVHDELELIVAAGR